MKALKKLLPILLWGVLGISVFFFLLIFYGFHFYYMEQFQLFLYNKTYLLNLLFSLGGLSEIIGRWLMQFYLNISLASFINTGLFLSIALLLHRIATRISSSMSFVVLPILTSVLFFFLQLEHTYYISGTIAYVFALSTFLIYIRISKTKNRILFSSLFTLLLFCLAGSVGSLFAGGVIVWELLMNRKNVCSYLVPLITVVVFVFISVRMVWIGEYSYLMLPDFYFHKAVTPPLIAYLPWLFFLLLIVLAFLFKEKTISTRGKSMFFFVQLILVGVTLYILFPLLGQTSTLQYKRLDYYARTGRWNEIMKVSRRPYSDILYAYYLHVALTEEQQLAEQLLQFDHKGVNGLIPQWNQDLRTLMISNDLCFALGDISGSQHLAFECNVAISNSGSPRLYKRLIQTNLILGTYPVAEKYIKLLEQTYNYREWASEQRRFLYNDQAIEDDSLLGAKRKGLVHSNYLLKSTNIISKLNYQIDSDPTNQAAKEYLAAILLLGKQHVLFMEFVDKYYLLGGIPAKIPERLQEAILIILENSPEEWAKYNLSSQVITKYKSYKDYFLKNQSNPDLPRLLYESFGNTYWLYLLFNES